MSRHKLEVIFTEDVPDHVDGVRTLGDFSVDGTNAVPQIHIPNVGERLVVELPQKDFRGEVLQKHVIYCQKDIAGKEWDLVTRIIIKIARDLPVPDESSTSQRFIV